MTNNSLGRILFLLKGDWMINRKQHGLVAVIFLVVIWFIELVPLAFSRSFTEWEKAISSMDPSFIHFTIARVLYLFVFLSWVSNTLYHSRIRPEKRKVQDCRTKSTELTSSNNKTKSTKEGQKTRHLLFYILVNRWLSSI